MWSKTALGLLGGATIFQLCYMEQYISLSFSLIPWVLFSYFIFLPFSRMEINPMPVPIMGGSFKKSIPSLAYTQHKWIFWSSSVQFSSVTQSWSNLCDPMNRSMPGIPAHHQLPESTQTHVHQVSDAIQPSHPLSSPAPPALSLSQHQGLFQWISSSQHVAKVLKLQLQHQSLQWITRTDLPQNGLVGSPWSPRDSQESSPKPQFKSINSLVLSLLHSPTLTSTHDHWKNHSFD